MPENRRTQETIEQRLQGRFVALMHGDFAHAQKAASPPAEGTSLPDCLEVKLPPNATGVLVVDLWAVSSGGPKAEAGDLERILCQYGL